MRRGRMTKFAAPAEIALSTIALHFGDLGS